MHTAEGIRPWWWQCSDYCLRYIISLLSRFLHTDRDPPPPPPFSAPSLISPRLRVSFVDVKHHVKLRPLRYGNSAGRLACCVSVRLVSGRTSVRYRFGSPFSSTVTRLWFVDTVLWLCPSLPTLKWLSSLPILMQESFWWWQRSDKYIISLSPHLHTRPSPRP